jgi:hypothetical protein
MPDLVTFFLGFAAGCVFLFALMLSAVLWFGRERKPTEEPWTVVMLDGTKRTYHTERKARYRALYAAVKGGAMMLEEAPRLIRLRRNGPESRRTEPSPVTSDRLPSLAK